MVLPGQRVPDLHGAEGREEVGLFYQQDPNILSGVQGDQEEPEHKARGLSGSELHSSAVLPALVGFHTQIKLLELQGGNHEYSL